MTGNDIKSFLNEVFDENVSPAKISDLAKVFNQFREAWQKSKLESHYKVVFADVVFITVKRGNEYTKEGVFVAYGIREDNRRELLVLSINPTESAKEWGCLLEGYAKEIEGGWKASSMVVLVRNRNKNILIDTGCNRKKLINSLKKEKLETVDIDFVILTHNHLDHTLLTGIFENAKVLTT